MLVSQLSSKHACWPIKLMSRTLNVHYTNLLRNKRCLLSFVVFCHLYYYLQYIPFHLIYDRRCCCSEGTHQHISGLLCSAIVTLCGQYSIIMCMILHQMKCSVHTSFKMHLPSTKVFYSHNKCWIVCYLWHLVVIWNTFLYSPEYIYPCNLMAEICNIWSG